MSVSEPRKYRKKPVVVEAWQWDGKATAPDRPDWLNEFGTNAIVADHNEENLKIKTLEGVMTAIKGDWIIKGVKGEFYPCKPDIFAATYEPANSTTPHREALEAAREALEPFAHVVSYDKRAFEIHGDNDATQVQTDITKEEASEMAQRHPELKIGPFNWPKTVLSLDGLRFKHWRAAQAAMLKINQVLEGCGNE